MALHLAALIHLSREESQEQHRYQSMPASATFPSQDQPLDSLRGIEADVATLADSKLNTDSQVWWAAPAMLKHLAAIGPTVRSPFTTSQETSMFLGAAIATPDLDFVLDNLNSDFNQATFQHRCLPEVPELHDAYPEFSSISYDASSSLGKHHTRMLPISTSWKPSPKPLETIACDRCKTTFQRRSDMRRHLKKHEIQNLICPAPGCLRRFYRQDKLEDHLNRLHKRSDIATTLSRSDSPYNWSTAGIIGPPVESFKCDYCPATFPSHLNRARHTRNHGPRPHQCDKCSKDFIFRKDLLRHENVHTEERNSFFCSVAGCKRNVGGKGFTRRDHLLRHESRVHWESQSM
ncbi:hypothetical protein CC86DRAFT_454217 [Ophiobolus disseminans]|uniref:C2H2-type domain-containing protein n=1 Tax=Ophiobolus disseminans TaxID=1469910 RepID=A0A6A7A522_9PLEO|nr:hypothetical protein CC86DRAFT_454217 [Ophiobolus disseminans]